MSISGQSGENIDVMRQMALEHHAVALCAASSAMGQLVIAETELSKGEEIVLEPEHVAQVVGHYLPDWYHATAMVADKKYQLIKRTMKDFPVVNFSYLQAKERVIGLHRGAITIMMQDVSTEDLLAAVDIEKQIVAANLPPLKLLDRLNPSYSQDLEDYTAQKDRESPELTLDEHGFEPFGLTAQEEKIAKSLLLPIDQIAADNHITTSTARNHLLSIRQKFEVDNTVELLIELHRRRLIDMSDVPEGETEDLTPAQLRVLTECHNMTYEEGAKKLSISASTIRTQWHEIYCKTNTNRKLDAVALGLRDRVIK